MSVCVCVDTRRDMAVLTSTQNRHAAWPPPSAVFLTPAQRAEPPPALLLLLLLLLSSCRYSCRRRCSFSTQNGGGFAADKSVCAAALEKKGGRCLVRCGVCMCACMRVCVRGQKGIGTGYRLKPLGRRQVLYLEQVVPSLCAGRIRAKIEHGIIDS